MNCWLWCSAALFVALLACVYVCAFKPVPDRLIALEFASVIVTLQMILLAEGFHRPSFYDLPLTLALLSFGGGMVFARFLQRWL
ncbi:MAG TPA: monovalent cation/H+ antiporter complex subunit F [Verrucomicrobiae bacterium]|nr:monovalent cation/H+ antiporter complex subunit F [Verrucomicrobiae bacterium]